MSARIIGTGSYAPDNIVTNDYLSTIMDTSDEWISSKTGIKERRISQGEGTASMATKAAIEAIKDAGISSEEIDFIVCGTCSPDNFLPSTACEIQAEIGAVNATCFDLSAACSGFIFGLQTARAYIESGIAKTALVVGAENLSKIMDWSDRTTCVLFGDGAGAAVVKKDEKDGGVIDVVTGSDGTGGPALCCPARDMNNLFIKNKFTTGFIKMDGHAVYKFAVTVVPDTISEILKRNQLEVKDIKYFLLHQANKRIIESISKRLHIDMDKLPMNLERYGNTSAASIAIILDEMNRDGCLKPGDKIVISGFGGGLTWGTALIEW